jgi:hypothetical protein
MARHLQSRYRSSIVLRVSRYNFDYVLVISLITVILLTVLARSGFTILYWCWKTANGKSKWRDKLIAYTSVFAAVKIMERLSVMLYEYKACDV